eukprot:2236097-Rhodomonas_salina.1
MDARAEAENGKVAKADEPMAAGAEAENTNKAKAYEPMTARTEAESAKATKADETMSAGAEVENAEVAKAAAAVTVGAEAENAKEVKAAEKVKSVEEAGRHSSLSDGSHEAATAESSSTQVKHPRLGADAHGGVPALAVTERGLLAVSPFLLGRLWPAERWIMGLRACKHLRRDLMVHCSSAALVQKAGA